MNRSWPMMNNNSNNASGSGSTVQINLKTENTTAEQTGAVHNQPLRKPRRFRYAFTTDQINYLENIFKQNKFVTGSQRKEIAREIGVADISIKTWFQNRRMKEKNVLKEQNNDEAYTTQNVVHPAGYPPRIPIAINKDRIIPNVSPPKPQPTKNFIFNRSSNPEMTIETKESTTTVFKSNLYQDISPVPHAIPRKPIYAKSPPKSDSYMNSSKYKASAEYSIDLCKKYKNILTRNKNEDNITTGNTTSSQLSAYDLTVQVKKPELQDEPQDLSMKKSDSTECYESFRRSPTFVNIPQPTVLDSLECEKLTLTPNATNTSPVPIISLFPVPSSSKISSYVNIQQLPDLDGPEWEESTLTSTANNTTPAPSVSLFPVPSSSKTSSYVNIQQLPDLDGPEWEEPILTSTANNTTPAPSVSLFPVPSSSKTSSCVNIQQLPDLDGPECAEPTLTSTANKTTPVPSISLFPVPSSSKTSSCVNKQQPPILDGSEWDESTLTSTSNNTTPAPSISLFPVSSSSKISSLLNTPQPTAPDGPVLEELILPPAMANTTPVASIPIFPVLASSKIDVIQSCVCCNDDPK